MRPIIINNKMPETERAHQEILNIWMASGDIISYIHQPWTFLITGHNLKYTPDFLVVYFDHFEIHEIKMGILDPKTGKYIPHYKNKAQEATIKMCAHIHPWYKFKVYWYWGDRYKHFDVKEIRP